MIETPHFQIGHMCAGCKISNLLHTGCVVNGGVRIIKDNQNVTNRDQSLSKETSLNIKRGVVIITSS